MVLSEEHRTAAETSPPPQQNTEASTPMPIPRAPLPKKARVGAGSTQEIVTGSTSTPLLDDVSSLFPRFPILFCLSIFPSADAFSPLSRFLPLTMFFTFVLLFLDSP
jgi:hypothetical protein